MTMAFGCETRAAAHAIATFAVVMSTAVVAARQTPARDAATPAATGTGVIAGTLVSTDSGRPVRGARVSLTGSGSASSVGQSVMTDSLGVFAFANLPAGAYTLSAVKPGYLDVIYGQRRPGTARPGTPIQLGEGQRLDRISLEIPRGGAITGTVRDEQGEPVFNQQVRLFKYTLRAGERSLQSAGTTMTDDRGAYRIGVLTPGEYLVGAFPRDPLADMSAAELKAAADNIAAAARAGADQQMLTDLKQQAGRARDFQPVEEVGDGYAPMYYPGTLQLSAAQPVLIEVGQERSGVDLQLQLVRTARVSGVVSAAEGASLQRLSGLQVTLVDSDQVVPGALARSVRPGPDGSFMFGAVPPGHYTVFARAGVIIPPAAAPPEAAATLQKLGAGNNGGEYWALSDVAVDGRAISDLSLSLQRGMSVSGSVKLEGATTQAFDLTRVRISLVPADASAAVNDAFGLMPVVVDAAGRFAFPGVAPGKYRVSVSGAPPAWSMKSAMFAGQDVLDVLLEVKPGENQSGGVLTMTTRMATLSGMLEDASGQPTSAYTIIVFAADSKYWTPQSRRIQATRPGTDGHFSFSNLPAGDYRLVAVTDVDQGQWLDPAFLHDLAGAALPLALGDGERRIQDLRVK